MDQGQRLQLHQENAQKSVAANYTYWWCLDLKRVSVMAEVVLVVTVAAVVVVVVVVILLI